MKSIAKRMALIMALMMMFTAAPGIVGLQEVSAQEAELAKPKLTNHAASATSIKNTWKRVKGADGYELFRSVKLKGKYKKVKNIKKGKTVSWTDKKVKRDKSYYYKVRAYNKVGGDKEYSKFSSPQWAAATNYPNWTYSIGKKSKRVKIVRLTITNKSKARMTFSEEGVYLQNKSARNTWNKMSDQERADVSAGTLKAKRIYPLEAAKKYVIKPGKSVVLKYKLALKVKYTKYGTVESSFRYNKKEYGVQHSNRYGESIWCY